MLMGKFYSPLLLCCKSTSAPVSPRPQTSLPFQVLLKDTDERACAFIAGAAPNRWGYTADGGDLNTINQPCPPGLSGALSYSIAVK